MLPCDDTSRHTPAGGCLAQCVNRGAAVWLPPFPAPELVLSLPVTLPFATMPPCCASCGVCKVVSRSLLLLKNALGRGAGSTPIGTSIERFLAAAAGQRGKTAAPPANARSSPRVAGRTQPSIHAGGEKSPPAHGRTRCTLCTPAPSTPPASMRACRLDDGRSPPLRRAQRLRLTRIPPAQQQRAPRCPPAETLPRRGRALTPPAQTLRTPQCTPPVTARPGPAHAARPAPHSRAQAWCAMLFCQKTDSSKIDFSQEGQVKNHARLLTRTSPKSRLLTRTAQKSRLLTRTSPKFFTRTAQKSRLFFAKNPLGPPRYRTRLGDLKNKQSTERTRGLIEPVP